MMRLLAAVLWLCLAQVAAAQEPAPDFESFKRFAGQVETDLDEQRLSTEGFEMLRERLVRWREELQGLDDINATQIEALNAQIDALGPPPAEGETEPADIAERREQLEAELAEASEPRLTAEESLALANALINRIDGELRARQTDRFLELQTSPLAPPLWRDAAQALGDFGVRVQSEIGARVSSGAEREELSERAPVIAGLLLLGLLLILRGPRWIDTLTRRVEARPGALSRIVWGFLVSLGAVLLPMLGITAINLALVRSGLLGEAGEAVAIGLNLAIIAYVSARWLGQRIFPERAAIPSPIPVRPDLRRRGRREAMTLGAAVAFFALVSEIREVAQVDDAVMGLPVFLAVLGMGIGLVRMGRLLLAHGPDDDTVEVSAYGDALRRLAGRILLGVGVVGPLLGAVGYVNMAEGIVQPTTMTLGLVAFLAALHVAMRAGWGLARGLSVEEAEQALVPVLVTLALTIASIPLLALIWGMRTADLAEIWTQIQAGVRIGETRLRPGDFVTFALVFAAGFLITRALQGTLRSTVLPRTRLDRGGRNALVSGLGYLGITLAAIAAIMSAGIDLSNLALVVGALGVGIGFGLQNIVNNFVSGIILLIERPIGEGDWVEVNGATGFVKAISVRSTRIETFDRTDVIVPNGDLISGTVTNWTRGNSIGRVIVPVGVAYGTDTRRVEAILSEIARSHPIVAVNPEPVVLFMGFGADSLDFEIRAILTDVNFLLSVRSDLNHEIARRFAEEGIEIPFAQRDVWLRNPEALRGEGSSRELPRPQAVSEAQEPLGAVDRNLAAPEADD